MKKKPKLTKHERNEIFLLLEKGYSDRSIARALDRSPNTISYEIKKNSVKGVYLPKKADMKARVNKTRQRKWWSKIESLPPLKAFIIEKLQRHWNPDEIAGYLKLHQHHYDWYVSKTAIYDWLRTARGERYCDLLYSKRRYVRRRSTKSKKVVIPNRTSIAKRFLGADHRSRYGHWEKDAMVSPKRRKGSLAVAVERKSRLICAKKVASMSPVAHATATQELFACVAVQSITFDNGIENRDHEKLSVPTFFCDPYSSWQKGSVEHANKMLRRYFPKGTVWQEVSQEAIDHSVMLVNEKPRKILGYRSAFEVAECAGILKRGCPN